MVKPDWSPTVETIEYPAGVPVPEHPHGAPYPPLVKLADGRLIVDYWRRRDGTMAARVWRQADHPNMAKLPANAPRAVRHMFTKAGQLALIRLTDDAIVQRAYKAWDTFAAGRH